MYRRNFVILLMLLPFTTIAQRVVVRLELPEEIGYLEPFYYKYVIEYSDAKEVFLNSPFSNWKLYIRREDNEEKHLLYSAGQNLEKYRFYDGFVYEEIFRPEVPNELSKKGLWKADKNHGWTFQPGNYILELIYYPYDDKERTISYQDTLQVVDYSNSVEKEAAEWINSIYHPLFLYEQGPPGLKFCYEKYLALCKGLIEKFPESRFAATAHLRIAAKTETFHWRYDIEYSKEDYDEIIYHYEQAEAKKTGIMKEVMRERVSEKLRKLKFLRKRHY